MDKEKWVAFRVVGEPQNHIHYGPFEPFEPNEWRIGATHEVYPKPDQYWEVHPSTVCHPPIGLRLADPNREWVQPDEA